jgi:Co/Zn/Cd efflux system component
MTECGNETDEVRTDEQRRILVIALILNVAMFVVEFVAGILAQSTGLLADALDMLADASAYGVALVAIGRGASFKRVSANISGLVLLVLGGCVLFDVARRSIYGSDPEGILMMSVGALALVVNTLVFHLAAAWIFTRADVIANLAVILSGFVVWVSGYRAVDLLVGAGIGLYVIKEALEILARARRAGMQSQQS